MNEVGVSYGPTAIVSGICWTVCSSDRWMIRGPNGSGKSTLLSLITGDNPKAYGQQIMLFGRPRGSGESVWDIKRRIGFVSGDLQFSYPLGSTVRDVVLSGFFDSIGLYDQATGYQRDIAEHWLDRIGLARTPLARLRDLSFGQRRMALIARAIVKEPDLLIADEPCQGLDDEHSRMVLDLLEEIGFSHPTCLLYVTHSAEERLDCITHVLELIPGMGEASRSRILLK
ncbi:MAG: ATP-binding cassette domain-containing protein [Spirochaetales bacterium]|nr:MAG: ATP-binding cassette domain-containing protein [Spirochaetales bacterium]